MTSPTTTEYRPDIDGLRALAVMAVVLFHADFEFIPGGFVGVDIFFVISGYLITGIVLADTRKERFSLTRFYERRARRIIPALLFTIFFALTMAWLLFQPHEVDSAAKSAIAALTFSSNLWFWREGLEYFAPAVEMAPLLHTWSLAVEEQFYIFFPLLIVFLHRVRPRSVAPGILAMVAISFALSVLAIRWKPSATFYLLPTRAWELGLGSLLATRPAFSWNRTTREVVGFAGMALLLFPLFAYTESTVFPGLAAAPPCLGTCMIIAAGAKAQPTSLAVLRQGASVFIGKISYSLYLLHWPLIVGFKYLGSSTALSPRASIIVLVTSLIGAAASWKFIEQPFRTSNLSPRAIFAWSGGGSLVIIAVAAVLVFVDGAKLPVTGELQKFADAVKDEATMPSDCIPLPGSSEGLCKLGAPVADEAPYDFLLWGDSHARAISAAVSAAAAQHGRAGLVPSLICPPLLGVVRTIEPRCTEVTARVLDTLLARDDLKTVILHARWAAYESGKLMPGEPGNNRENLNALRDDVDKTGASIHGVFERGFKRTVDAVLASGRRVVVIEGVPEIGWNVPNALLIKQRWGIDHPQAPTLASVKAREEGVTRVFQQYASNPRVKLVDMKSIPCASGACAVDFAGTPAYFDDDHLTKSATLHWFKDYLGQQLFATEATAANRASRNAWP